MLFVWCGLQRILDGRLHGGMEITNVLFNFDSCELCQSFQALVFEKFEQYP